MAQSVAELIAAYLEHLAIRNYSAQTLASNANNLRLFAQWCEARGIHSPDVVTKKMLERYQRHQFYARRKDGKPYAFTTQHARLVVVRSFFGWLCRQDFLDANPAADLLLPKKPQRLPRNVLTPEEVEQVMAGCDIKDPIGLRDRAMLELFYATGMRRAELVGLSVPHVDTERETAFILEGKGGKDRMVPIGERAALWVEKYKDEARPLLLIDDDSPLFISNRGGRLNLAALSRIVSRRIDAADLGKKGSCHLFRHTCATHMLEGGADIRYIQAMLGHARLDATEVYTQVAIRALKAVHSATHPGARLERARDTAGHHDDITP